jgi:hypothetical protein
MLQSTLLKNEFSNILDTLKLVPNYTNVKSKKRNDVLMLSKAFLGILKKHYLKNTLLALRRCFPTF